MGPNLRDGKFHAISDHQTDLTIVSLNAMGVKGTFDRSIIFGHKSHMIERDVMYL